MGFSLPSGGTTTRTRTRTRTRKTVAHKSSFRESGTLRLGQALSWRLPVSRRVGLKRVLRAPGVAEENERCDRWLLKWTR
jgi:hypothetical protein